MKVEEIDGDDAVVWFQSTDSSYKNMPVLSLRKRRCAYTRSCKITVSIPKKCNKRTLSYIQRQFHLEDQFSKIKMKNFQKNPKWHDCQLQHVFINRQLGKNAYRTKSCLKNLTKTIW